MRIFREISQVLATDSFFHIKQLVNSWRCRQIQGQIPRRLLPISVNLSGVRVVYSNSTFFRMKVSKPILVATPIMGRKKMAVKQLRNVAKPDPYSFDEYVATGIAIKALYILRFY